MQTSENQLPENSPQPLGSMIDELSQIREQRRELAAQDADLGKTYDALKERIKLRLLTEGADMARGHEASASLTYTVVPTVKNWEALYKFILETNQLHLLEKRVATGAFRELNSAGSVVPGVEPFTKIDINLRNI